jgi:hypothetical protein
VRRNSPTSYVPTLSNFSANSNRSNSPLSPDSSSSSSASGIGQPISIDLAPPPAAHISGETSPRAPNFNYAPRPMHIIRAPSYNPPAFDAEEPPPALETPPPDYGDIASPTTGLADYFSRLSDAYAGEDGDAGVEDEENVRTPTQRLSMAIETADTSPVGRHWV